MDSPWIILGLDANTATEREVKAAYARLLKLHRPETDPEGFQRVRTAYQQALHTIKYRETRPFDDVPEASEPANDSTPPATVADISPAPAAGYFNSPTTEEPLADAIPPLRAAIADEGTQALTESLRSLLKEASDRQIDPHAAASLLRREFQTKAHLLAKVAPPALMRQLLETGNLDMVETILGNWMANNRMGRVVAFAEDCVTSRLVPADESVCRLLARLAESIAFNSPEVAQCLADQIFPVLSTRTRQMVMHSLESEIALGRIFHGFPPEMTAFWRERLSNREATVDWNTPAAKDAVNYVVNIRGHSWVGLPLVHQIVPEPVWKGMERKLQSQAKSAKRFSLGGLSLGRLTPIVAILLINLLRHCPDMTSRSVAPRDPISPAGSYGSRAADSWQNVRRVRQNPVTRYTPPPSMPVFDSSKPIVLPTPHSQPVAPQQVTPLDMRRLQLPLQNVPTQQK